MVCSLSIALAAWIIYGYVIYFSDDNDCQKAYDTSVALVFMCIFLICGLCTICSALGLLIFVPYVYFGAIRPMQAEQATKKAEYKHLQGGMRMFIQYMQVPPHKMALLQDDCAICLEGFDEDGADRKAVQLPCGHVFHSDCIIAWIDSGKSTCPVCKRLINPKNKKSKKKKKSSGNEGGDSEDSDDCLIMKNSNAARRGNR